MTEVEAWAATSGGGSSANVKWLVSDHLGTPRMVFDQTGSLANVSRHDYLPFGEELFGGPPSQPGVGGRTTAMGYPDIVGNNVRQKFTSKERDIETGLDYFLARYYSSTQGRFTSPDEFSGGPEELFEFEESASDNPTFYADTADPQSLNKYTYVYNNPSRFVDPDGHQGTELVKTIVRGAIDTQIAVDKSGLNIVIGAANIGNAHRGQSIEPLQPSNNVQEVTMRIADKVFVLGSLLGGRGPTNVVVAETKQATVVAGVANTRVAATSSKSVTQMAGELSAQLGKNSVGYTTPNKVGHIDLRGKAHFDKGRRIATPHVQERALHRGPNGRTNVGPQTTRAATKQDVRTARKIVERRKQREE